MTPIKRSALHVVALASLIASSSASRATAQPTPEKARARPWRTSSVIEVTTGYDDNVFLLTSNKLDNLATPSASSRASGRYADMESSDDLVTLLRGGLQLTGPGIAGRKLTLAPRVEYDAYVRNSKRRHFTMSLGVEQAFRHDGRMRLRAEVTPGYFAKNYLADARDQNNDGSIEANERVYAAGTYTEQALSVDYELRLAKSARSHPFGAALRLGAGYYGRRYDAPFASRDLSGPTMTVALPVDLTRRISLQSSYERQQLSATPTRAVLLLDESQFRRDFNGNGRTSDVSARAFEMVDRSRVENSVSVGSRWEVTPRVDARLGFERRWRSYESAEPYDIANNGRRDRRNEFGVELDWTLVPGLHLTTAGRTSAQSLNRENDPGASGEIDDYRRTQFSVGLARRF